MNPHPVVVYLNYAILSAAGLALPVVEQRIREHAHSAGLTIVAEYADDTSAPVETRAGWQAVEEALAGGRVHATGVLTWTREMLGLASEQRQIVLNRCFRPGGALLIEVAFTDALPVRQKGASQHRRAALREMAPWPAVAGTA